MRPSRMVVVGVLAVMTPLTLASAAHAGRADVVRRGTCSSGSTWKFKLSPDNGRIEVELEVDQNVVGDRWRVVMRHDGNVFVRDVVRTKAPSGSFDVQRKTKDRAGTDRFRARAVNRSTGEVCRASASI